MTGYSRHMNVTRGSLAVVVACTAVTFGTARAAPMMESSNHSVIVTVTNRVSERTRQAQYILLSHGYAGVGPADGIYGRHTAKAVKSWQRSNGIVEDGIGPATMASLLGSIDSTPKPAVRSNPTPRPVAPPTAAPTPVAPPTDVEQIIRDVFPDDLEDHAVAIAMRESRLQPEVINANGNATGLFQIMWTVHRSWMCPQLGVCAQSDLQDARINAEAALALFQRDGGWGPWKL